MVNLTDPINAQNIVDRFKEVVTDVADKDIVWGTDNLPGHSSFSASDFGGVVDGMQLNLVNATGSYSTSETVTGSISGTVGTVVSYSNNVLKVRNVVAGSGQTNFVQNDIITGSNSGATGSVSTMTEISAVSIGITGNSIGNSGTLIQANSIYCVLKDEMNIERMMWANDFPHSDSTWPHSQQLLKTHLSHMSEKEKNAILHDNAASLYGLSIDIS